MSGGEPPQSGERSVADLDGNAPGESTEDVYEDVDIESLPAWWQDAIELFEEREMRPYQPARFDDGEFVHTVVESLEEEYGVSISFRCVNATIADDWTVLVDWEPVGTVGRYRSTEGYTVYDMTADEFSEWLSEQLIVD